MSVNRNELKRVVISGLGALTPIGNTLNEFWQNLLNGKSGAANITKFDTENYKVKFACEVKDFDPLNFLDKKEARKMDSYAHYAMVSAEEAINDAQLQIEKLDAYRCGVIWASGVGGLGSFQNEVANFGENGRVPRFTPFFIPKFIADIAAGLLSMKHGFKGPNFATVSACASSTNALIDAFNYIRLGKADCILSGGSEAAITETGIGGFMNMKALSQRNESPQTACRPFDKTRDGFVLGEGAGAVLLEELEHARKRGAKIYAEVVGGGATADAYHMTAPHPDGQGALMAMTMAMDEAEISPAQVDYINTHATSTPVGDLAEIKAIEQLFAGHLEGLNISATKSMTGHLLGAAGAIEGIAAIKAVQENIIPPTINTNEVDEAIEKRLNLTLKEAQKKEINYAMSNTFGFGGHNAIVLFRKFEP